MTARTSTSSDRRERGVCIIKCTPFSYENIYDCIIVPLFVEAEQKYGKLTTF